MKNPIIDGQSVDFGSFGMSKNLHDAMQAEREKNDKDVQKLHEEIIDLIKKKKKMYGVVLAALSETVASVIAAAPQEEHTCEVTEFSFDVALKLQERMSSDECDEVISND